MSSKTPTIDQLMGFLAAQKEQEKEIERKRQCLLKGTPYSEETAETARDGPRKSRRHAPKSTKFDDPYPQVKSALAQTIANRKATKKAISMEQIREMCALRFASYEKSSETNEEKPEDEKPMNAEKKREEEDGSVEEKEETEKNENKTPIPAPSRQSGRVRKTRTPFEAAN